MTHNLAIYGAIMVINWLKQVRHVLCIIVFNQPVVDSTLPNREQLLYQMMMVVVLLTMMTTRRMTTMMTMTMILILR
jgi:hypothetical protein